MTGPNDKGVGAANANPLKSTSHYPQQSVRRAEFVRERVPDWIDYAARHGHELSGAGKWRTTRCDFHGGSDSLRVNVESGGWVCMACFAKGGDTLSFHMQLHGLDFMAAARAIGAVREGQVVQRTHKPAALAPRDALAVLHLDAIVVFVYASNLSQGVALTEEDRQALNGCVQRIGLVCSEIRS